MVSVQSSTLCDIVIGNGVCFIFDNNFKLTTDRRLSFLKMSLLLSLPNELLVNYIFAYNDIGISDLFHLMHSCSRLNLVVRKSNKLWKEKYGTRYCHV
jgi:hypothetical protein